MHTLNLSSKAILYLYFNPELVLSAAILFPESQITAIVIVVVVIIIIINLLIMLTSEQCFIS